MATYKIVSDNVTLGKKDSIISDKELDGFNKEALIEGGHIEAVNKPTRQEPRESDK